VLRRCGWRHALVAAAPGPVGIVSLCGAASHEHARLHLCALACMRVEGVRETFAGFSGQALTLRAAILYD